MIASGVCFYNIVGMNTSERFLVRMLNRSQEVPSKDA